MISMNPQEIDKYIEEYIEESSSGDETEEDERDKYYDNEYSNQQAEYIDSLTSAFQNSLNNLDTAGVISLHRLRAKTSFSDSDAAFDWISSHTYKCVFEFILKELVRLNGAIKGERLTRRGTGKYQQIALTLNQAFTFQESFSAKRVEKVADLLRFAHSAAVAHKEHVEHPRGGNVVPPYCAKYVQRPCNDHTATTMLQTIRWTPSQRLPSMVLARDQHCIQWLSFLLPTE